LWLHIVHVSYFVLATYRPQDLPQAGRRKNTGPHPTRVHVPNDVPEQRILIHDTVLDVLQQDPDRAVVLEVQPQPPSLPPQIALARRAERSLELLRRGLLERRLRCERCDLSVLLARAARVVRVDLVDPFAQWCADGRRALRDDLFADALQVVVDALRGQVSWSPSVQRRSSWTYVLGISDAFLTARHPERGEECSR
jgi:hypothetical protein